MDLYCPEDPIVLYREIENAQGKGFAGTIELADVLEDVSTVIASRDARSADAFIDRFSAANGAHPPVESVRVQAIIGVTALQLALLERQVSASDLGIELDAVCTELHASASLQELQDRLPRLFHHALEHLVQQSERVNGKGSCIARVKVDLDVG